MQRPAESLKVQDTVKVRDERLDRPAPVSSEEQRILEERLLLSDEIWVNGKLSRS